MSIATSPGPVQTPGDLHRLSLEKYETMIRLGVLDDHDRVVLLDGLLVNKMGRGERHLAVTRKIFGLLFRRLPEGWTVFKEDPIVLKGGPRGDSAPKPDVTVLVGNGEDYDDRKPTPEDVALVVEVADSSVEDDRKGLERYNGAGIREVWIVNLPQGTVEVYTEPTAPGSQPPYATCIIKGPGDTLTVTDEDDQGLTTLLVSEILRPRPDETDGSAVE